MAEFRWQGGGSEGEDWAEEGAAVAVSHFSVQLLS